MLKPTLLLLFLLTLTLALPQTSTDLTPPSDDNITSSGELDTRVYQGSWGGYLDKCQMIRFYLQDVDMKRKGGGGALTPYLASPRLAAKCPKLDGSIQCSNLDLTNCIANSGGQMVPRNEGGFHTSCYNCWMTDNRYLECFCQWDAKKNMVTRSKLDLNAFVHNWDGWLRCFQVFAFEGDCPPEKGYEPVNLPGNFPS